MDVNNRTRLERKLAEELAKLSGEQLRKILAKMGDPPDVDNLPEGIWTSWAQDLRDALGPFLLSVAQAQAKEFADGIPRAAGTIDWALANREARAWAQAYTFDLVGGIIDHSRESVDKGLQAVLRTAIGEGAGGERGRWSIADVTDALSPYFGPARAETIAVTEITRASAEAESRLVDQLGAAGIDLVAVWNTREDELVCPICGGFDTQEADENGQWVTDEGETVDNPPAHPRCRCFLTHRMVDTGAKSTPPKKKPRAADKFTWQAGDLVLGPPPEAVKDFNPDQPRDEGGRFASTDGGSGPQATPANLRGDVGALFDAAAKQGDAQKVLGDHFDKWAGTLSPVEKEALTEYQNSGYGSLNDALRNGSRRGFDLMKESSTLSDPSTGFAATHETFAKVLDGAISRGVVPEDVVTVRGMDLIPDLERLTPGQTFMDKGFVSTSAAQGFTGWKPVALELLVPKGSNAAYMPSNMEGENREYDSEKELLLPRGASFQVVSYETVDDSRFALGKSVKIRAVYLGPNKVEDAKKSADPKPQDVPKHDPAKFVWKPDDVVVTRKGTKGFDPDQPRDERGRFGSGGGSPPAGGAQGGAGGRPVDVGANGKPLPKLGGYYASDACPPWKDEQLAACNFEKQGYDKTPLRFPIPEAPEGILAGEEAHAALVAGMDNRAGLSLDHASAITYYQGAGAYDVNKPLRADKGDAKRADEEAGNLASVLSDAIDRTKTPVDVVVYRGAPKGTPDVGVGDTFTDHAFVSATTSPHVADQFSGHAVDNGTEFVLTIPKGTNAVYVDAMGGDQKPPWNGQTPTRQVPLAYERELILQRGSSFRVDRVEVVKHEGGGTRRYLYATHVGDAGPVKALAVKAQDPQDRRDKWIWKPGDLVLGAGPLIMGSEAKGAPDQPRDEAGRFASTDGFGADPSATGAAQVEGRVAGSPGKDGSGRWVSSRVGPSEPDYKGMDRPLLFGDPTAGAWESTHAELMKAGDIRDQLEPFHARAIAYYQSSGYAYANDLQRQDKPEQADAYGGVAGLVTILSDAVDRSRVPADVVVMRGAVDDKATGFAKLKPGQTFTDKGFVSTSASPATAESFMDTDPSSGAKNVQMVLTIPKGTNGLYVDALAGAKPWKGGAMPQDTPYGEERELLLQRGSSFRVDKVETVKAKFGGTKITRIHATHVGDSGRYVEHATKAYNPDQPRDERGRFGSGSGAADPFADIRPAPGSRGEFYGPTSEAEAAKYSALLGDAPPQMSARASISIGGKHIESDYDADRYNPGAVSGFGSGDATRAVEALPLEERRAIVQWGVSGAEIRAAQRGDATYRVPGDPVKPVGDKERGLAATFERALDALPPVEGMVLRGMSGVPVDTVLGYMRGEAVTLRNDMSATISDRFAQKFTGSSSGESMSVEMRVETRSARYLGDETYATSGGKRINEYEAVLRKGATLQPVAVQFVRREGTKEVDLTPRVREALGYVATGHNPPDVRDLLKTGMGADKVRVLFREVTQ